MRAVTYSAHGFIVEIVSLTNIKVRLAVNGDCYFMFAV